jgi:hypothetical protein
MLIYETDTGYLRVWDGANWDYLSQSQDTTTNIKASDIGAAWETWTPTVTQSATVTCTNTLSRYGRIQKTVFVTTYQTVTGAGTAGSNVILTVPVNFQSNSGQMVGFGWVYDASTTTIYNVMVYAASTSTVVLMYTPNATGGGFGSNPAVTLAVNDQIRITLIYEAA